MPDPLTMTIDSLQTVLITGAGGWLGSLLPQTLVERSPNTRFSFILADVVAPKHPKGLAAKVVTHQADLSDPASLDALFATEFGHPDVVYSMHGIMSLGSEENWDLGMKINFDSTRLLLEKARHSRPASGEPVRFVFTSSVATYGGELPEVVLPSTSCTPEGAYGTAKLMGEYLVSEYSRMGFVNGLSVKLPTIVPRPGVPSRATSAFVSSIVREPLAGVRATCPIGTSPDDPLLSTTGVWVAKPSTTLINLAHANRVLADRDTVSKVVARWSRSVQLPGFTTTVREIIDALREVKGDEAVKLITFDDDETCRRIVSSWPRSFDNSYAQRLGFVVDTDGFAGAIREYMRDSM